MASERASISPRVLIGPDGIAALITALHDAGFHVVGPTVCDGAIDYREIETVRDLPTGWSDIQKAGSYRLQKRDDEALFQYASTPQSWKRLLHPPVQAVLTVERTDQGLRFIPQTVEARQVAFLGARSCDLHAMGILERALAGDPQVGARRKEAFVVAVHCGRSASTCFCASMASGPRATDGFDLALTELLDGGHRFLVEVGSERGARLLGGLETHEASRRDLDASDAVVRDAAEQQRDRQLDPDDARAWLLDDLTSNHWEEVATRCTSCGACTMVCPTCFCSTMVDSSDIASGTAARTRLWDSCFSQEFSYIHGGNVRVSGAARYRQWITHKLAYWHDQFDTSGCVGCGRCITWCPVGIDIVDEAQAAGGATPRGDGS